MDKFNRPSWDSYFMSLAFVVSQRSIDPATKHGTIIVDKNHRIVSMGYNGPPSGANDDKVPLTRPAKYNLLLHSEVNCIDNCTDDLAGMTVYVTGVPCSACLLRLVQRGVGAIIYGKIGSNCCNEEDARKSALILEVMEGRAPKMIPYNDNEFIDVLNNTLNYIARKTND